MHHCTHTTPTTTTASHNPRACTGYIQQAENLHHISGQGSRMWKMHNVAKFVVNDFFWRIMNNFLANVWPTCFTNIAEPKSNRRLYFICLNCLLRPPFLHYLIMNYVRAKASGVRVATGNEQFKNVTSSSQICLQSCKTRCALKFHIHWHESY